MAKYLVVHIEHRLVSFEIEAHSKAEAVALREDAEASRITPYEDDRRVLFVAELEEEPAAGLPRLVG